MSVIHAEHLTPPWNSTCLTPPAVAGIAPVSQRVGRRHLPEPICAIEEAGIEVFAPVLNLEGRPGTGAPSGSFAVRWLSRGTRCVLPPTWTHVASGADLWRQNRW